jgi:hypothetical protein
MPASTKQTVLHRIILTAPVRQRDEAFFYEDEWKVYQRFASRRHDERARQWQFRNAAP